MVICKKTVVAVKKVVITLVVLFGAGLSSFGAGLSSFGADASDTIWYVSPDAPAVGEGVSEDAPTSLTNALARAEYGDTVQLADGDYQLSSLDGIFVTNGISLLGDASCPANVTIHAVKTNVTAKLLYVDDASVEGITFTGAYVNNNTTSKYAALFATNNAVVANCVFTDMSLYYQGTQVRIWNDTVITNTVFRNFKYTFENSWGSASLGLFYATGAILEDCFITNNAHCSRYAGLVVLGTGATLKRTVIADNYVHGNERSYQSAGLNIRGNSVLVEDCVIQNNSIGSSHYEGSKTAGGVYVAGRSIFRRTVIRDNYAVNGNAGGVMVLDVGSVDGRSVVFENCLIAGNSTGSGSAGGVYISGTPDVKFYYTTIAGNYANANVVSHGLYLANKTGLEVHNSIINGNGTDDTRYDGKNFVIKSNALVTNSCISTEAEVTAYAAEGSGEGCIYVNPLFADLGAGDYTINAQSPCFDKGASIEGITLDIVGNPRESWNAPDMGAYEYVVDGGRIDLTPSATYVQSFRGNVDFSAYIFPSDNIAGYTWIVTEANGDRTEYDGYTSTFSYNFSELGTCSVALRVKWNNDMVVTSAPCQIEVLPGKAYVSSDGGNVSPYDTPDKAARNINDAMKVVYGEEEIPAVVVLLPGVYNSTIGTADGDWFVNITKPIILQGGGERPQDTVLDGELTHRILSVSAEARGTVVSNLFLINAKSQGATDKRRGYAADLRAGVMQSCIISNSYFVSGYESVVYLNGASIVDSTVCKTTGTIPEWKGDCGNAIHIASGLADGCLVYDNIVKEQGGAPIYLDGSGASAVRCVVRGNTLWYNEDFSAANGGGAAGISARNGATVEKCEIYNNTANGSNVERYTSGILAFGGSRIVDCIISNNTCNGSSNYGDTFAAGILSGKNVSIKNSLITGNKLTSNNEAKNRCHAGGIACYDSGTVIKNCTIYGNKNAMAQKSGIYLGSNAITNSIVWGNGNQSGGEWVSGNITNTTGSVAYTCSLPLEPGDGNTDGDPKFVDSANGNYRLKSSSSARNKGDSTGFNRTTDLDLDGNRRWVGKSVDMGAYECQQADGFFIILK